MDRLTDVSSVSDRDWHFAMCNLVIDLCEEICVGSGGLEISGSHLGCFLNRSLFALNLMLNFAPFGFFMQGVMFNSGSSSIG